MVEFRCSRTSEDMTPVIRDIEIAKYAEKVLYDYRPELLETTAYFDDEYYEPALLDPYDFAVFYLGADIEVHDIYTDSNEDFIAGAAIFNLQKVKVFDKENMCTRNIIIAPNTILLDSETVLPGHKGFEHFTIMHEAGHLMLHQKTFRRESKKKFFIEGQEPDVSENAALCKRSNMGTCYGGLKTSEDFREHQANTFAANMLMPPRVFIPYVQMLMQRYRCFDDDDMMITWDFNNKSNKYLYYLDIVNMTARQFGVSGKAAKVQMTKYGLQADPREDDVKEARRRIKLYQSLWR